MAERVEWGGQMWYFYRDYFRNRRGQLLHRQKYIAAHGPIPRSVDVHHADGDKRNNDLSNLVALSRSEHIRAHGPRGTAARTRDERRAAAREQWAQRAPRERTCEQCGRTYLSTGQRARFCHLNCKMAWLRRDPEFRERRNRARRVGRPGV